MPALSKLLVHAAAVLAALAVAGPTPQARAQAQVATPTEFRGADLKLGEALIREHRCSECHARRVDGDGSAIYKPGGRISRPSALLAMVEMCSVELKLQLFPEDVLAVAAVLNRDHYRFQAVP